MKYMISMVVHHHGLCMMVNYMGAHSGGGGGGVVKSRRSLHTSWKIKKLFYYGQYWACTIRFHGTFLAICCFLLIRGDGVFFGLPPPPPPHFTNISADAYNHRYCTYM